MYLAAVVISTVFAAVVITIVMYSIVLVFFKMLHYCWKRGKNKDKYVLLQNTIQYNIKLSSNTGLGKPGILFYSE